MQTPVALSHAASRAGLWLRHICFVLTPAGQSVLAAKRRLHEEAAWSDTVPSPSGLLFRLTSWPDLAPARRRAGWLQVLSVLSVDPFSFDQLVVLAGDDAGEAAELFVELMVAGCIEVLEVRVERAS